MSATRESTLGRNNVVAIIRILQYHLLCSIETYLAKPYSKIGVQALVEELAKIVRKRIRDAALSTFIHHYTFAAKSKSIKYDSRRTI